ncbi:nuclear transport factor 2 family protein [Kluyvera ascorbata]|uniref:nuclear transport factor 2 family protein n=1 Tax=Kluyvera ascorbata TaxID=51288 RepID=UPI0035CD0CDF
MINVIIPMSGHNLYETSNGFAYPKLLTEVANKTLLEYSQDIFKTLAEDYKIIYVAPEEKLNKLGLKSIINTISDKKGKIVSLHGSTKGAVCSSLMAIDEIDPDSELIISSADHYIEENLQEVVDNFRAMTCDAGVLTFQSVHPKWSFVLLNDNDEVIQAAEKDPISRNAIAGFYYFKKASDFVAAAKNLIRKDSSIDGGYYLSSCLNELVLDGKIIKVHQLNNLVYHNFYDAHAVNAFGMSLKNDTSVINDVTKLYIDAFNSKRIDEVMKMFEDNASLVEPGEIFIGCESIKKRIGDIFNFPELKFSANAITCQQNRSVIEFKLTLGDDVIKGVDIIEWSRNNKIAKLTAYLM